MKSADKVGALATVSAFPLDEIATGKALLFPVVMMLPKVTEHPEGAGKEMAVFGSQDTIENGQQEQAQRQTSRLQV